MDAELAMLVASAVAIGAFHTLIGVDHTLPFVLLGRAEGWHPRRVLLVTFACGAGHVLASVLLGAIGLGLGLALGRIEWIEAVRGEVAAWFLIVFGLTYAGWALARPRRRLHGQRTPATAWALFLIFVLGPCEPLVPLLLAPALDHGLAAAALVGAAFAAATLCTMLLVVGLAWWGISLSRVRLGHRHAEVFAGLAVAGSGLAIQLLGI